MTVDDIWEGYGSVGCSFILHVSSYPLGSIIADILIESDFFNLKEWLGFSLVIRSIQPDQSIRRGIENIKTTFSFQDCSIID